MADKKVTWALLAPLSPERLDAMAKKFWDDVIGDDAEFMNEWRVEGGSNEYSALLDTNPGSEDTHEPALAKAVSREVSRPVYVLQMHEHLAGTEAVDVYERGRKTSSRLNPRAVARELGYVFADDPRAQRLGVSGAVLVEGIDAMKVGRALGMNELPRGPVHIVDGTEGALMYSDDTGPPPVASRLSNAFPQANVYIVSTGPNEGLFRVRLMRDGKEVGVFEHPTSSGAVNRTVLETIRGKRVPREIANALGVPLQLLGPF